MLPPPLLLLPPPLLLLLLLLAPVGAGVAVQKNVSCTGGGSLACTSNGSASAPKACCNVGSYRPDLRCYDPGAERCCHYDGGPAGPPQGSLCARSAGGKSKCCVQMCYDPSVSQCCEDQYGEGHTCGTAETCQVNGCGPAPPQSGSWCAHGNATGDPEAPPVGAMRLVLDSEAGVCTFSTAAATCTYLPYTYDASGEFPGQGTLLLHSANGTCMPTKMGAAWADTLLVWSGDDDGGQRSLSVLNKVLPTLPPLLPLSSAGPACPVYENDSKV
jgi:hypothetical protein